MENMMKLYEIKETYHNLMSLDIDDEKMALALQSVTDTLAEKVENIGWVLRTLEAENNAYNAEIERFKALSKSNISKTKWLKNYLSNTLKDMNVDKLSTDSFKLFFRKSTSINITNEASISKQYLTKKTSYTPNKTKIKKAIQKGIKVNGASLIENQNLQIK